MGIARDGFVFARMLGAVAASTLAFAVDGMRWRGQARGSSSSSNGGSGVAVSVSPNAYSISAGGTQTFAAFGLRYFEHRRHMAGKRRHNLRNREYCYLHVRRHVTPVFEVPETEAANVCVPPAEILVALGETETATAASSI